MSTSSNSKSILLVPFTQYSICTNCLIFIIGCFLLHSTESFVSSKNKYNKYILETPKYVRSSGSFSQSSLGVTTTNPIEQNLRQATLSVRSDLCAYYSFVYVIHRNTKIYVIFIYCILRDLLLVINNVFTYIHKIMHWKVLNF